MKLEGSEFEKKRKLEIYRTDVPIIEKISRTGNNLFAIDAFRVC